MSTMLPAIAIGMLIVLAGSIPRNIAFALNLRYAASVPWAVPVVGIYIWLFWRYLSGEGPPDSTREFRRAGLRANPLSGRVWAWAIVAGGLGVVALVLGLRVANHMVVLPQQQIPDLSAVSRFTVWSLLLAGPPVAGIIEEAAFRGYMQAPLERRYGLTIAILVTGTMFAVAHLDFTLVLWPYYVAVAAIYGGVTYLTDSILPAVVLHTSGNVYSNLDLLLHGQAEWQASPNATGLVWTTGADATFIWLVLATVIVAAAAAWAFIRLSRASHHESEHR